MGPPPTFEQSTGLPGYAETAGVQSVTTAEIHTGVTSMDGRPSTSHNSQSDNGVRL